MKRGLIIGKFMVLHMGHVALIRFAAARCDELIVSLSHASIDGIPGTVRFGWIKEQFGSERNIKLELTLDEFDDESLPASDRAPIWAAFIRKRFPRIDIIFSSEEYGDQLARELGVPHIPFDLERRTFPVSSTLICERPFHYWDFIAVPARGFFVKKICLYGPESTGKSTLAKRLSEWYQTDFVPEVSREIITSNDFTLEDIVRIGLAQTQRVLEKSKSANKLLFCDTDVITTEIYSFHYLRKIPPLLFELEKQVAYDRYFLFDIDVAWVDDGLRDLGDRRREMFEVFKEELEKRKITYQLIHGDYPHREAMLKKALDQYFV